MTGAQVRAFEDVVGASGVTPPVGALEALADVTALRKRADGRHDVPNSIRGPLLYALVAARRPRVVLEFGTGRGYGALSAAAAMVDLGIDGTVFTIDVVGPDDQFDWTLRDKSGARTTRRSRRQVWAEHVSSAWIGKVVELTGRTIDVVSRWEHDGWPSVDLAFVDGGHDLRTARFDLAAAVRLASSHAGILVDDYAVRPGFGVVEAVRELFKGRAPITLIPTEWGELRGAFMGMAWIEFGPDQLPDLRATAARVTAATSVGTSPLDQLRRLRRRRIL